MSVSNYKCKHCNKRSSADASKAGSYVKCSLCGGLNHQPGRAIERSAAEVPETSERKTIAENSRSFKQPMMNSKTVFVFYWNSFLAVCAFVGYFHLFIFELPAGGSILLLLLAVPLYLVCWVIAIIQLGYGIFKFIEAGDTKTLHYCFSAIFVAGVYVVTILLQQAGYFWAV